MWDLSTDLWFNGELIGKVGGVFTGASSVHGGQETTALSMMLGNKFHMIFELNLVSKHH